MNANDLAARLATLRASLAGCKSLPALACFEQAQKAADAGQVKLAHAYAQLSEGAVASL